MRKLMLLVLILTGVNIYANERMNVPGVRQITRVELWRGGDAVKREELASYGPVPKKALAKESAFDNISGADQKTDHLTSQTLRS